MPITIVILVLGVLVVAAGANVVSTGSAAVVERLGKFNGILDAGFHVIIPFVDRVVTTIPLRVRQHDITVQTKTKDNVFCNLQVSIQFQVDHAKIADSYYGLSDPISQIESYIQDAIRSAVPVLTLDEAFERKDDISNEVQKSVADGMRQYGFVIVNTLITDIMPDQQVFYAMNKINAAQRERAAAQELAEAERIKVVTEAKAKAESAELEGKGLAAQRSAIIDGLSSNMQRLQDNGISNDQVMQLLLLTQYMNTIESIGTRNGNSCIFLPGGADSVGNLSEQLLASLQANARMHAPAVRNAASNQGSAFIDRNHNGIPDNLEVPPMTPPAKQTK